MSRPQSVVAVGVVTRSHLAGAAVALSTWARWHPASRRLLYVVDDEEPAAATEHLPERVPVAALGVPRFRSLALALPAVGLCCLLKPHVMLDALARSGADAVVYFDGDVSWHAAPTALLDALQHSSLVLTPHLLRPVAAGVSPDESVIRPYGVWNAGLVAARGDAEGRGFLRWWADVMADPRRLRTEHGWDQCWLDFAPVFARSLGVLRDRGYNVALWNLAERPLRQVAEETWEAGGGPLVAFHFSCFDESAPDAFVRTGVTCNLPVGAELRALGRAYSARLAEARARLGPAASYAFGRFADGTAVTERARALVREAWETIAPDADPFAPGWRLPGDDRPLQQRQLAPRPWPRRLAGRLRRWLAASGPRDPRSA